MKKVKVKVMEKDTANVCGGSERKYRLDYEICLKNNFRNNVSGAVKFYLELGEDYKFSEEKMGGFILYPHALNPFLKIMETLGESRNVIVLPSFNNDDVDVGNIKNPAYLILKISGEGRYITEFTIDYM